MKCLIDGDVLLHELGWSGQFKDKDSGEEVLMDAEFVMDLLAKKIKLIEYECEADEASTLYLSSSEEIVSMWNRSARFFGKPELTHTPNFRYEIAKTVPYKGTRKNPKPEHFYNIVAHMLSNYDVVVSQGGVEADDELCIAQRAAIEKGQDTIICSRDKDLRICKGWHYSWECGKQPSSGPNFTDALGSLELHIIPKKKYPEKKVTGFGLSFFLYQMLAGDTADNIPGLPKIGVAKAYDLLSPHLGDKEALINAVKGLYKELLAEKSKEYFLEQAQLLWMVQQRDTPFDIRKLK